MGIADYLSSYYYQTEQESVSDLLKSLRWDEDISARAQDDAVALIDQIRSTPRKAGSLESFFQQYSLSTKEGLALMSLAEALLRIPDARTANALIRDKIIGTKWLKKVQKNEVDWLTQAAGIGLTLTETTLKSALGKIGEPVIREAMLAAMTLLGTQFVLGETLEKSAKKAASWSENGYRFSYDMLGEGARTMDDAQRYFEGYKDALEGIAAQDLSGLAREKRPGLSVKLSALHPRYELAQAEKSIPYLTDKILELCCIAARNDIGLTIDAEEVARLIPSLDIMDAVLQNHPDPAWYGLGLAVQAYQKSSPHVIEHAIGLALKYNRKLQIRLVKGAYWDTEVKLAQVLGVDNYPVYTQKYHTDLSYLRCAQKLLRNRDQIYPMFGTHNAHTVAAIMQMAGGSCEGFEFQKLYGMGDALYQAVKEKYAAHVCVYAPIGPYGDLLPYLVRRMLENGANSSFVNQIYDPAYTPQAIAVDPVKKSQENGGNKHPKIPLPCDLFAPKRRNSSGYDFNDPQAVDQLLARFSQYQQKSYIVSPITNGKNVTQGNSETITNPATADIVGTCYQTSPQEIESIVKIAADGHQQWSQTDAHHRASILEKIADLYEEHAAHLMSLCVREGGRTLIDAHDEVREAVDFCRYYAQMGRLHFDQNGLSLPSPTGETNIYTLESRGIFAAISPWNFPLAIFTGQIVAALMAGNSVIAKPAEQTPITAYHAIQLMHKAGVPKKALNFLIGDGRIGAAIIDHPKLSGVAFTGSTETAQHINRALAAKDGAIARLIAETGGQNALIVDSSALTEQVVDDVIHSAFGSAGQRCSACRILFLQEDIADQTIHMLSGAMAQLSIGDPSLLSTGIGPMIDDQALMLAQKHLTKLDSLGKKIAAVPLPDGYRQGNFFAPVAYEIPHLDILDKEVFAPILHVIRYNAREVNNVIDQINALGYGLTFGIHSRNQQFINDLSRRIKAGNVYVNKGTIGAVVGVQPFGGRGLSGTGPKAGGPRYLHAFATEKVVSTDTTAAGGNASLVMMEE